jgi:hypothetical protein
MRFDTSPPHETTSQAKSLLLNRDIALVFRFAAPRSAKPVFCFSRGIHPHPAKTPESISSFHGIDEML